MRFEGICHSLPCHSHSDILESYGLVSAAQPLPAALINIPPKCPTPSSLSPSFECYAKPGLTAPTLAGACSLSLCSALGALRPEEGRIHSIFLSDSDLLFRLGRAKLLTLHPNNRFEMLRPHPLVKLMRARWLYTLCLLSALLKAVASYLVFPHYLTSPQRFSLAI